MNDRKDDDHRLDDKLDAQAAGTRTSEGVYSDIRSGNADSALWRLGVPPAIGGTTSGSDSADAKASSSLLDYHRNCLRQEVHDLYRELDLLKNRKWLSLVEISKIRMEIWFMESSSLLSTARRLKSYAGDAKGKGLGVLEWDLERVAERLRNLNDELVQQKNTAKRR